MKKVLLILAFALAGAQLARSQDIVIDGENSGDYRDLRRLANKGFTNIGYSMQSMIEPISGVELGKSDLGASISRNRTFVLHRRPIARMLFIGLNATWIDINYAQYGKNIMGMDLSELTGGIKLHQADISVLGIGPSLNVFPIGKLGVHAYAKYNPTIATYFSTQDGFNMSAGYASVISAGGAVSWGFISLGAEARLGTGKYSMNFGGGDDDEEVDVSPKLKTSGLRFYLSFRY